jgi:hypothetical protein
MAFTFGLPLALALVLVVNRKTLHTPKVMETYGFLYDTYKPGAEYWDIQELMRRLLLTGILLFLPGSTRLAASLLVSILACCLLFGVKPHKAEVIQRLESSSFVILMLKYVGSVLLMVDMTEEETSVLGLVFILLDVIYMIHSIICLVSVVHFVWTAAKNDTGTKEENEKGNQNSSSNTSGGSGSSGVEKKQMVAMRMRLSVSKRSLEKEKEMNVRLKKNNMTRSASRLKNQKSIRTSTVEEIEKNHAKHRDSAVLGIKKRQMGRRSMLKARLAKREKDKTKVVPVSSGVETGKIHEQGVGSEKNQAQRGEDVLPVPSRGEHVSSEENSAKRDTHASAVASLNGEEKVQSSGENEETTKDRSGETKYTKEIEAVRLLLKTKARSINKFKLIFDKVDQDNNGSLSKKEFKHLMQLTVRGNKEFSDSLNVYFDALWVDLCQTCQNQHTGVEVDEATATKWLFDKEGEE